MALAPGVINIDNFDQGGTINTDENTVCGMLVKSARGPLATPTLVRSYVEYEKIFGGHTEDSDSAYAVQMYFENGGTQLYVSRAAHYSDIDAATTAAAKSELVRGSGVDVEDEDTGETADGSATYSFSSVSPIVAGTLVVDALDGAPAFADDGVGGLDNGDSASGTVDYETGAITLDFTGAVTTPSTGNFTIDYTPALITYEAAGEGSDGDNISVKTTVNRRVSTVLGSAYTATDTELVVSSPAGLRVGQVLYVEEGANSFVTRVLGFSTDVSGGTPVHTVDIYPADAVNSYTVAATVQSQEFDLDVFYGDSPTPVEEYTQLSLEADLTDSYVVDVLASSAYIRAVVDTTNPALANLSGTFYPSAIVKTNLSGGVDVDSDGSISAADLIGSAAGGQGLYALDARDEIEVVCAIPHVSGPSDTASATWSSEFIFGAQAFCAREGKRDLVVLVEPAAGASESAVLAARAAAGYTGDAASFSGMFYPQVNVKDPLGSTRDVSPLGGIMGLMVAVDRAVGPQRAAAGELYGKLEGALKAVRPVNKANAGSLNEAGISVIKDVRGKGTLVFGARTLDDTPGATFTYLPTKRSVIQFQRDISAGIQDLLFESNDSRLWDQLRNRINNYLNIQMRAGALKGTDPTTAYSVKVGEADGIQTVDDTRQGIVRLNIGVALQRPGEFFIISWSELVQ